MRTGIAEREVRIGNGTPISNQVGKPYRVFLRQHQSPGDVLVLTAAVESLMRQFPGQYRLNVETTCPDIWKNNPYIDPTLQAWECEIIQAEYPLIHHVASRPIHFIDGFCEEL